MSSYHYGQSIALIVVALSLLLLAGQCFKWAAANVLATQVTYQLNNGTWQTTPENLRKWRQARQQLQQILSLRSNNAEYLELAENFYQDLDTMETDAPTLINALGWQQNAKLALQFGQQAVCLRPSWPNLWKEIVLSKMALEQYDEQFQAAYAQAIKLGGWENETLQTMPSLAEEAWEQLSETNRSLSQLISNRAQSLKRRGHS